MLLRIEEYGKIFNGSTDIYKLVYLTFGSYRNILIYLITCQTHNVSIYSTQILLIKNLEYPIRSRPYLIKFYTVQSESIRTR